MIFPVSGPQTNAVAYDGLIHRWKGMPDQNTTENNIKKSSELVKQRQYNVESVFKKKMKKQT